MALASSTDLAAHQQALLLARRCPSCAEHVPLRTLLDQTSCPHCGQVSRWPRLDDVEARVAAILQPWRRRRYWIYGLAAAGSCLTGSLPVVATVVTLSALLVLRHTVLRAPMVWLGPRRRITTRLWLRLWLLLVALLALVLNELLTLLPLAGMLIKAIVSVAAAAGYLELGLAYCHNRIRREQRGPELDWWEWALPLAMLALILLSCVAVIAVGIFVVAALGSTFDWLTGLWR